MSYTKGPWQYIKTTSYHSIQSLNNGPCDIARIVNSNREKNANLISTAPELLEAIEHSLSLFNQYKASNDNENKRIIIDMQLAHYKYLEILIKRAKGE